MMDVLQEQEKMKKVQAHINKENDEKEAINVN